ncbi:MAG: hypothetical protein GXP38_09045 [Chloroflexi bacterium]|nr:hypothetical protein [Chloroflexota bacterium]
MNRGTEGSGQARRRVGKVDSLGTDIWRAATGLYESRRGKITLPPQLP